MVGVATTEVPSLLSKLTVTPWMPGSLASWMPLPFRSFQTKLPMLAGWYRPASQLLSVWPEVSVKAADLPLAAGLALLSNSGLLPWAYLVKE